MAGVKLSRAEELEYGTGWRVKGVVDDTDQCEHCGRRGLKRVVAMVPLDADGNEDGDAAYFGTGCAVGYIKRGTLRGRVTGAAVWTAALVAERERVERRRWAGEILAKYGHVTGFHPIQKAAVFFVYNPHTADRGHAWGAAEVDWFVSEADKAMEGVPAETRAQYIELGRKALGLPERQTA
ncbi:hypothetical protein [Streptomyces violaceusniger]|uniref:Uncharacterized protein n=1 Tax=Streptomyces violaceusniger (strain Tu 4113) TaxID=653045 RepID=G2PHQ5_STRV4|nr:hypothetical protein [Streptomyces violaceusniger]AEM88856.1 hypothetical protein Strvi_0080 [Streptomyces violaceusniger Tu 4113]